MTDRDTRFSPLTLAADGLLLAAAMTGLITSFLSLYGSGRLEGTPQATPLDLCAARWETFFTLAAVLALLSLAAWSLPRFRWAAAGGLALLLVLFTYSNWERVFQGAGLTVHRISVIFSQRVSWGWVLPYDPGLTQSEGVAAVRLFLSLSLAVLALILGWAVVRARRWWLTVLLTLPPLLPGLLADLYPGWLPFMALAACWCTMLLCDLCRWAAPSSRGKLALAVLPCVAVVLGGISLLFPREGYTRPQWALNMQVELNSGFNRITEFLSQFNGPFGRRVTYVGSADEADLTSAGPLNYTGRTVLRVRSDYEGRLYLRGSSLAGYENGVWHAMTDETFQEALSRQGVSPRVLFFPAMSAVHGPEHTVTVNNAGAVGSCVYAPYFLTVQELEDSGMTMVNDSLLARQQGRWTHTLSFVELSEPHPVSVQTGEAVVRFTDGQPGGADFGRYPQFVYKNYLDVPEEMQTYLAQFCAEHSIYRADGDPIAAAEQIAAVLNRLCEYDQSAQAPPAGADPVVYFLGESRRGYCMHFASAATLMLRSLGMPARYVSGFTAMSVPDREVAVPDRAAHAWVEVWVSGFGWYPVEVTPAAAFDWYQQGLVDPEDPPSVPLEPSQAPTPVPTPSQDPGGQVSEPPSQDPQGPGVGEEGPDLTLLFTALKAAAVTAGGFALLWLGQYLPKRHRAKRLASPDRNRAALDGYGYLRRMKRWGGRLDERAVELAQKARFSQHTLTPEELDELRALVDRERERLWVVLDPLPKLAFRYFWGLPKRPDPPGGEEPPENPE